MAALALAWRRVRLPRRRRGLTAGHEPPLAAAALLRATLTLMAGGALAQALPLLLGPC